MNFLRHLGIGRKEGYHPAQSLKIPDASSIELDNTRKYAVLMDWDTAANTFPYVRQMEIDNLTASLEKQEGGRGLSAEAISEIEAKINQHTDNMYKFRGSDENLLAVAEYLTSGDNIVNSYYTQPVTIGPRTLAFSMDKKTPRLVENPFGDDFNVAYMVVPQGARINGKNFDKPVVSKLRIPKSLEGGVAQDFAVMMQESGYGEKEAAAAYSHLTGN